MRIRDWYFQGWERREDESGKRVLVYTGEVYTFPAGLKAARSVTVPPISFCSRSAFSGCRFTRKS